MAVKRCCCDAKLSPNKKSIFDLRTQILSLLFVASFLIAGCAAADTEISCKNVRNLFKNKGFFSTIEIQDQPNSDVGALCLNEGCCAASAKSRLTQQAQMQLETSLKTELTKLAESLSNRARKFDEFFRKLLQQSREDFHAMFKRTYGMIYEQHSYVFENLFEQLERYYSRGDTDLDSMMESFFGVLYQKMFTVLNSQYSFDEKYLKCVSEHMRETQPFEDVPRKLSVQLRRAFVATRTFHKALRAGADVVRNMVQVETSSECVASWARLRYCGSCAEVQPPACLRYCHNVLRGCLPDHADLSQHWDAYVDAVEKVADRLIGPFNIVMVVEPIDIKISEAIMNFQEHNQEISQKIFTRCGKPSLEGSRVAGPFFAPDRSKRSVRFMPDFDWNNQNNDVDDFEIETSFETALKEDPTLYSINSPEEIRQATLNMAKQAKEREQFLKYMRGDIDAEEYDEHERKRREADPEPASGSSEIDYKSYDFDGKRGGKKKKTSSSKADSVRDSNPLGGSTLVRLVRETRTRIRSSRRYWANLPYLLCSEEGVTAPPSRDAPCFNGSHVASYTLVSASEGWAGLASNPEVRVGGAVASAAAAAQHDQLRALTARLKDAYNGVEVQWTNDDLQPESSQIVESPGSGSGYGEDDDIPDDDEDKGTGTDYSVYQGSGDAPTDDEDLPTSPPDVGVPEATPEVPFTPVVIGGSGETRNINMPDSNAPTNQDTQSRSDIEPPPPVKEYPSLNSAERPSLQKALFAYALPVVCAWFGTIITDLV